MPEAKVELKTLTFNSFSHGDKKKLAKLISGGWTILTEDKMWGTGVKRLTLQRERS